MLADLRSAAETGLKKWEWKKPERMNMPIDFVSATDVLFIRTGPQQLAIEIGRAATSIRQARLKVGTKGHRAPPPGWEAVVARLARQKAAELQKLADRLASKGGKKPIA